MTVRVVHVVEAMGGGVQSALSRFVGGLPDVEHIALVRPRVREKSAALPSGVQVREFHGSTAAFLLWTRRSIIALKPDAVHFHSSLAGVARIVSPKAPKLIYSPHCFAFERRDRSLLFRMLYRAAEYLFARRTDEFIAVSPHEARLCRGLASRNTRVTYVPNTANFTAPAATPGVNSANSPFTITMIGRIGPQKAPRVYAELAEKLGPQVRMLWLGDGDPDLRSDLVSSGVDVMGWQPPSEVERLLAKTDLYVHTALWESAPMSIVEAAAMNVPVLVTSLPSLLSLGWQGAGTSAADLHAAIERFRHDEAFQARVRVRTKHISDGLNAIEAGARLRAAYGPRSG